MRTTVPALFGAHIVVANVGHRFVVAEQLRAIGADDAKIVLEPVGRNTAPAVAIAATIALRKDPDAVILVAPSDHVIGDETGFRAAIETALPAALSGELVLFGVRPTRPETGYGYIRPGDLLGDETGVRRADAFVEKPDGETAAHYVSDGYLWNSGIFLLPARGVLEALSRYEISIVKAAEGAVASAAADLDFIRVGEKAFSSAPTI